MGVPDAVLSCTLVGEGNSLKTILNTLPHPIIVLGSDDIIIYVNPAAEIFFSTSAVALKQRRLGQLLPLDSPILDLIHKIRQETAVISEYGIDLNSQRLGTHLIDVTSTPIVEATPTEIGEVILSTAFSHGLGMAVSGNQSRAKLPIVIGVQDNCQGPAEDIKPYLFEAFVTNKLNGSGLGLALVDKLVNDHGGIVEHVEGSVGTLFRIMLPMDADWVKKKRK